MPKVSHLLGHRSFRNLKTLEKRANKLHDVIVNAINKDLQAVEVEANARTRNSVSKVRRLALKAVTRTRSNPSNPTDTHIPASRRSTRLSTRSCVRSTPKAVV